MFRSLEVSNFQSLETITLDLAPFTVIVGPSNSGKSAVLRALRAAVRNVSSPAAVRVGHKQFSVRVDTDEGIGVAIERGPSHSTYRLFGQGEEQVFTKAGRTVPEEIQQALRLPAPEGPDLAFSTQIDPPFLLAESGSVAAKMLGDLTNVSKLHAAAKEANRRRMAATSDYKIRSDDARACLQRLQEEFGDLKDQVTVLNGLKDQMSSVREQAREVESIQRVLSELELVEAAVSTLEAEVRSIPGGIDLDEQASQILELVEREGDRRRILTLISTLAQTVEEMKTQEALLTSCDQAISELNAEYRAVLTDAGTCPMCGSEIAA